MIAEDTDPIPAFADGTGGDRDVQVAELARALARTGHDLRVYAAPASPRALRRVQVGDGVTVLHPPMAADPGDSDLPALKALGQWLATHWHDDGWQPEIIHAHHWRSGLAAIHAGQTGRTPTVQTIYPLDTEALRYESALGRAMDRVIAQSRDEYAALVRMRVPRAQLTLVPAGIDTDRFTADGPAAPRERRQRHRILTVGRLDERHGFADVVEALRLVPGAECVVIGEPAAGGDLAADPVAVRLHEIAADQAVDDRLRLVGAVPAAELPAWYRSADVVVAAGREGSFGTAPMAAMACGVPVVASAVGGLAETVVDGVTGELVAAGDPRALGTALRRLLQDEGRRFAYATAAADRARQCYSWDRVAAQVAGVYAALLPEAAPEVVA